MLNFNTEHIESVSNVAVTTENSKEDIQLPIVISVFNQKGGVGKTTATYELGYVLYKMFGLKVLMVDADPQASLTAIINPDLSSNAEKAEEFEKELVRKKQQGKVSKIDDIFECALGSRRQDIVEINRAKKVEILQVHNYTGLFYLPGSMRFSQINKPITLGLGNVSTAYGFVKMVPAVFREIGRLNNIDIILIDLNPGIDGLNESIIMHSDYLFIPFKPSLGCLDSVKNLTELIPSWFEELRRGEFLANSQGPLLLGTFPQIMRTRNYSQKDSTGKKIKIEELEVAYETWIRSIFNKTGDLLKEFEKYMMTQPSIDFSHHQDRIGVRDMVGPGLQAQASGHPMSDIGYPHRARIRDKKHHAYKEVPFTASANHRKHLTNISYRKILGSFLQYFRPEHIELLSQKTPDFVATLSLYRSLSDELERCPQFQRADIKKSTKKQNPLNTFWYTDEHITTLLTHFLQDKNDYFFTTPMQGDGRYTSEVLRENIERYLLDNIPEQSNDSRRTIFIPLNIGAPADNDQQGGNHWVLAIIRINGGPPDEIFYFDPLHKSIPRLASEAILGAINLVFNKNILEIQDLNLRAVQTDGFNCGPWIVEQVRTLVSGSSLDKLDINAKRREHCELLTLPDQPSAKKRKRKDSLFDSPGSFFRPDTQDSGQASASKLSKKT